MKSSIIFTGSGPILVLTTYTSLDDPDFVAKLADKGIRKFVAYDVAEDLVKEKYGTHYDAIINDVQQTNDLRVLDYDGHHVFHTFSFANMGQPVLYEP